MKKIIFTGLVSVMTIMAVTSIMWKLKQADSGICSRTGTRLNDVELRQAVIASLISIGLDNVHHQDVEYSRGTVKLRIIDQISDVDIAKAIFELKNGSDFFARYSDAKEIERLPSDHDSNPIKEPFILFNYSTYGGYMATRTASSDIDSIDRARLELDENYPGFVSATGPRACYDESKRIGETMCMLYGRKYQMPIGVARPFNNYGPGSHLNDKRVTADFVKAIEEEKDIEILSDGSPTRTFCYVADAVAGYLKILLHGSYDYFNIGIEGPEITVGQLAQIYVKKGQDIFGYRSKVTFGTSKDKDYLTDNPQRRCPSIAKARKLLGYAPEIEIEEGVERYLRFIAESPESEYKW